MKKVITIVLTMLSVMTVSATQYYIAGNGTDDANHNWCNGSNWGHQSLGTENAKTFYNVAPGGYGFKITDGTWDHTYTTISTSAVNVFGGNGSDISFYLREAADVTVSFDGAEVMVSATKPFIGRYWVTGNGSADNPWCGGKSWWCQYDAGKINQATGLITYSAVPAGTYQFKITNGKWSSEGGTEYTTVDHVNSTPNVFGGNGSNIWFKLTETADVTIAFDGDEIVVTSTSTPAPRYYLTGSGISGLDWGTKDMAMNNDEITLVGMSVSTGNCQVKVTDGSWDNTLGYSDVDAENSSKGYYVVGDNNNLGFWVNYPCDVTIKVVNGKIQITGDFVKLYVAGNGESDANGNWVGGHNWWTTGGVALPDSREVSFENVAPGTYSFQFASGDWSVKHFALDQENSNITIYTTGGSSDNIGFVLTETSDVTIRMSTDHKGSVNVVPVAATEQITMSQFGYATYYNSTEAKVVPSGLTAYVVTGVEDDMLVFEMVTGAIPAGTGVMLEGAAGDYDMVATTTSDTYAANLFLGTDETTTITSNGKTHYILGVKDNQVGFYYGGADGTGDFTNGAHKAYLEIPTGVSAPSRGFVLRHTPTGVEAVSDKDNDGLYYDMFGRSFIIPTTSGLYIHNGERILIVR